MTVLDVADWAMTAAPYVPAAMILGALVGAVYAAHLTAGAWRERRAKRAEARRVQYEVDLIRRLGDRIHREPLRPTRPGPDDHQRRQLEQLYQMPAWEDETR